MRKLNVILLLVFFLHLVSCKVLYIVPSLSQSDPCFANNSCWSLSQFAANSSSYIDSNTTLLITGGSHVLDKVISVSNVAAFSMLSVNDIESVNITCSKLANFTFSRVGHVFVSGLTFIGCSGNKVKSVSLVTIVHSRFLGKKNARNLIESSVNMTETSFVTGRYQSDVRSVRYSEITMNYLEPFSATVGGALIVAHSTLAINNCQFEGNRANIGGAIFSEDGSNITISNSVFISNQATVTGWHKKLCFAYGYGGALFTDGTGATIINNSTFRNNTSNQYGGSVAVIFKATVLNNVYNNTTNRRHGGTLHNSALVFKAATFVDNRANHDGGAVYLYGSSATVSDCDFRQNMADRMGGAIASNASSSVTLSSSNFTYNSAGGGGGVVYAQQNSNAVIDSCTINHNSAHGDGGVVHAEYDGTIAVNNSTFLNNSATGCGGVLFIWKKSSLKVGRSNFSNNTAKSGGVMCTSNNTCTFKLVSSSRLVHTMVDNGEVLNNVSITICNSIFYYNKAECEGGVIEAQDWSSVVISNSSFNSNVASVFGGVVHIKDNSNVSVYGSAFDLNTARNGGVFNGYSKCSVKVYKSSFVNNTANVYGGVLSCKREMKSLIEKSNFSNNTAHDSGAVIYVVEDTNTIIHKQCIFTQNSAVYGGVLVVMKNSAITVDEGMFSNNTAHIDGGILYARTQCTVFMVSSSFISNKAINNGITLASESSSIELDSSTFRYNEAGHDGGAVYVYDNSTTTISSCNFTSNMAGDSGGAVYGRKESTITICNSTIYKNKAQNSGGGVYAQEDSNISIQASNFTHNTADYGVVHVYIRSTADITTSNFSGNKANIAGGAMAAYSSSTITVQSSNFTFNSANVGGVSIAFQTSFHTIEYNNSTLRSNTAEFHGITRVPLNNAVALIGSTFLHNTASYGGVLYAQGGDITIDNSTFDYNNASDIGGAIYATRNSSVSINTANFSNNAAESDGGVMALAGGSVMTITKSGFTSNRAHNGGGVVSLHQSSVSVNRCSFNLSTTERDSGGVIHATNSSVKVDDSSFTNNIAKDKGGVVDAHLGSSLIVLCSNFTNNTAKIGGALYVNENSSSIIANGIFEYSVAEKDGGVILASALSKVNIIGSNFNHNTAENGAALAAVQHSSIRFDSQFMAKECQAIANGETQIHDNTAQVSGEGIYLNQSKLYFEAGTNISHNQASTSGGGVHAVDSFIIIGSRVHFDSNQAMNGGGISLANSSLYYGDVIDKEIVSDVNFVSNQAHYGGALFIDDKFSCHSDPYTGVYSRCFFHNVPRGLLFNFTENYANSSGHNLFGGLLDRCTVVSDTNSSSKLEPSSASRFEEISNIRSFENVSSEPVRVCLCKDNKPDCSQEKHDPIQIKRGNKFSISLAAVDQVYHTVTATVQSSFENFSDSQTAQKIGLNCSNVDYQVPSPYESNEYKLTVYAEGPCGDDRISNLNIDVHIVGCLCPPGFMPENRSTGCDCVCDNRDKIFSKYIKICNSTTESVIRKGIFWIAYINDTNSSSYLIYPYCPLDYCQPPSKSIYINLKLSNGSDSQCANNRGGILCGSCQPNYSLSLGSSKCIKCPENWYGLLVGITIAAFFAGIVFVVILLALNLTVAVRTLNPIIFYANIINANSGLYFGQSQVKFVPVFISWLNLDIGFDTCFFEGMDVYAKTWLQLVFPVYIMFLVIIIIWLSSCSSKFSNLIGKRNPVATLATLILLSYTQLLEIIITSFSFVIPNGTSIIKWFPDASIKFCEGKHIILVCVAILIIFVGLLYTVLIFFWQWILNCPRSNIFKWTRNHKIYTFIDTYHIPHTAKHRYWTGLLLVVRVIVYIIIAFSASSDQPITLLSTVVIMCCLVLYKMVLMIRVYKNWLLNAMESFVYFNIIIFTVFTLYIFEDPGNGSKEILHRVAAYISVGTTIILFLFVLIFHMYKYGNTKVYSWGQNTKLGKMMNDQLLYEHNQDHCIPSDGGIYNLLDVIDNPRVEGGYTPPPLQLYQIPTSSVVSMTNCDKPSTIECPLNQKLEQGTQDDDNGEDSKTKPQAKTLTPKFESAEL